MCSSICIIRLWFIETDTTNDYLDEEVKEQIRKELEEEIRQDIAKEEDAKVESKE